MTQDRQPHTASDQVQPQWSNEVRAWVYPPQMKLDPNSGEMREVPALSWDPQTNRWELLDEEKAQQIFPVSSADISPLQEGGAYDSPNGVGDDHSSQEQSDSSEEVDVEAAADSVEDHHDGAVEKDDRDTSDKDSQSEDAEPVDAAHESGSEIDSDTAAGDASIDNDEANVADTGAELDSSEDLSQGDDSINVSDEAATESEASSNDASGADSERTEEPPSDDGVEEPVEDTENKADENRVFDEEADATDEADGVTADKSAEVETKNDSDEQDQLSLNNGEEPEQGENDVHKHNGPNGNRPIEGPAVTNLSPVRFTPYAATLYMDDQVIDRIDTPVIIGRRPQPNSKYPEAQPLVINDTTKSMSKIHAVLKPVKDGVEVRDLGSTNGTWIVFPGGQKLSATEENPVNATFGSRICCGNCVIIVRAE